MSAHAWRGPLLGLLLAIGAGFLCAWLRTPLPWMIGPLFAVSAARLAGAPVERAAGRAVTSPAPTRGPT